MENKDKNKEDPPLNDYQRKQMEDNIKSAKLEQQTQNELRTEERFKNYFEGFNTPSVEGFIKSYASKKAYWHRFGDFWVQQVEAEELQWINEAQEHLGFIQQKKLFDAQCLWRAEKISIREVEICVDFQMWERDIFNCPFIEPISQEDIELYAQYLQQSNVEFELGWLEGWQDYEDLKEAYQTDNGHRNFPEWYDFYNGRKGTGVYMLLPDVRGEKEEHYCQIAREQKQPELEAKQAEWDKIRDKRPSIKSPYDKDFMNWFVTTFEDKQTQEYFKADRIYNRTDDDEESISGWIQLLLKADEPIAIEAHHDWKQALENAAEKYRRKKIAEFLPAAFEEYQLNLTMGIFPLSEERDSFEEIRKIWSDKILKGRELSGEPLDFNF